MALWGVGLVLALVQALILLPIAALAGRSRQFHEWANFQIAVAESAGTDRFNLRQGYTLLRLYERLPPLGPDEPERSGQELLYLADDPAGDDSLDEDEPLDGERAYS